MKTTEYLTINELAETFKISRRTVYREIDRGIPYIKVGHHKRFDYNQVLHWFKTKK